MARREEEEEEEEGGEGGEGETSVGRRREREASLLRHWAFAKVNFTLTQPTGDEDCSKVSSKKYLGG